MEIEEVQELMRGPRQKITQQRNQERIFDRQLQTYGARVLEHAFNDGIVPGDKVDDLYLLLEGLRLTQVEEMKGVLYEG